MSSRERRLGAHIPRLTGADSRLRARLVPLAEGVVVELGPGTGRNLPFYDRARVSRLHAVVPPGAEAAADFGAAGAGLAITVLVAPFDALPLDSGVADTVVVTYAFGALDDAGAAMSEARRVLRPGGRLLVLEQGRAPSTRIAGMQDRLDPLWRAVARGHLNRDITGMLDRVGFDTSTVEQVYLRGLPRILGAHHLGVARAV